MWISIIDPIISLTLFKADKGSQDTKY